MDTHNGHPTHLLRTFPNGMRYILLDEQTVAKLTIQGNKRVICRLNDKVDVHAAILTNKAVGYFVYIGASVCKSLGIDEGSHVSATFSIDTSEHQFEMPEELREVLDTDPEAGRVFDSLTEGNKRGLMYLVSQVKSSDKRIERSFIIAAKLKRGITSPREILK